MNQWKKFHHSGWLWKILSVALFIVVVEAIVVERKRGEGEEQTKISDDNYGTLTKGSNTLTWVLEWGVVWEGTSPTINCSFLSLFFRTTQISQYLPRPSQVLLPHPPTPSLFHSCLITSSICFLLVFFYTFIKTMSHNFTFLFPSFFSFHSSSSPSQSRLHPSSCLLL